MERLIDLTVFAFNLAEDALEVTGEVVEDAIGLGLRIAFENPIAKYFFDFCDRSMRL